MKKTSFSLFFLGFLAIVGCLAAAYYLQSAYLLFVASIIPVFILPYLPDLRSVQQLNPLSKDKAIQIYGVTSDESQPNYVVIEFKPGKIHWNKQMLYFSADHVAVAPTSALKQHAIALPIHKHDLVIKKGKYRWVGIRLKDMNKRSSSFSFKLNQVNRLVISIQDIKDLFRETTSPKSRSAVEKNKQLQA